MKKAFKIIGISLLVVFIFLIGIFLYLTKFGKLDILSKDLLSTAPRPPRLQYPVTYNIDWWSDQKALSIDSFMVVIIESKLNLFNSKSLISYKVHGHLTYQGKWQAKIEQVHISERLNFDTTVHCDRIIEITPIVKTIENNNVNRGVDNFEFENEHAINSTHWGINRIKFICGAKERTIELLQAK